MRIAAVALPSFASFIVALSLGAPRPALAEDAPAATPAPASPVDRLALATERVVVFKDGYALFVKNGTATADKDGRVYTDAVPDAAVLGCVWATGEGRKILAMRAGWDERKALREREEACVTTLDLLRANLGKEVVLGLTKDGAADVRAKVVEVLENPPADPAADAMPGVSPRPSGPAGRTVRPLAPVGGQMVVLAVGSSQVVLPVAEVRTISGSGLTTKTTRREEVTTRTKRLGMDLGKDAAGKSATVRLLYFTEGVRWIPTYRVGGGLATDAEIALQGELINEAEDFEGANLDLVVGVPSFQFKDVASPLVLERVMRSAIGQAAPQLAQQMLSNSNRFGNDNAGPGVPFDEGEAGTSTLSAAPELAREAEQDLFVYGLGKTSLRRGQRATYPIWQSTAPLRHVYTMDVVVVRDFRSGEHSYFSAKSARQQGEWSPSMSRGGTSVGTLGSAPVWHELELANGGGKGDEHDVPWTTGAALVMRGEVPLGQNVLRYTSPGGKTLLPLTVAVDLQGKWEEQETERRANALNWSHNTYSLIRKHGTITLTSRRREASTVRVSTSLGGKAEAATEGGRVTVNDVRAADWGSGAQPVNNHSDVVWDLTLAPGETKKLEVDFSFFVQ